MSTALPAHMSAAIEHDLGGRAPVVTRVLLADDHPVFREGLRASLHNLAGVRIEGEAYDAASTLELVRRTQADVLLLDLSMPGRCGIDLIRAVLDEAPVLKILVLTMYEEHHFAQRAFMAGAQGYLTKRHTASELSVALRKVAAGGTYVGPWLADHLARNLAALPESALHQKLSDREFDIFMRFARGERPADIGEALGLSAKTVANYKARIFRAMGFSRDAALVHYALRHQLIDDHDIS